MTTEAQSNQQGVNKKKAISLNHYDMLFDPLEFALMYKPSFHEVLTATGTIRVVNLFSGDRWDSLKTIQFLAKIFPSSAISVTAVDIEIAHSEEAMQALRQLVIEALPITYAFEFIQLDALEYLKSLSDNSVEIITAFGSDPYLSGFLNRGLLKQFLDECFRVGKDQAALVVPYLDGKDFARTLPKNSFEYQSGGIITLQKNIAKT